MRAWTTDDFEGHWPVGSAAVVVAETATRARELLVVELAKHGLALNEHNGKLVELPLDVEGCVVICDGNY